MCLCTFFGGLVFFWGVCIGIWALRHCLEKEGYQVIFDSSRPSGCGRWTVHRDREGEEGEE